MQNPTESADNSLLIPFSTMDEAMMHSDTRRYHCNVHVEVRAPGKLDAQRMREAVYKAMKDHPLARSRRAEHKPSDRNLQWEIRPEASFDPLLVVEAGTDPVVARRREQLLNLQPSLDDSPPFYVWLVRRNRGDSLIFNFNHAATDGIGAQHFLRSVINHYAGCRDPRSVDPLSVRKTPVTTSVESAKQKQQQKEQMDFLQRNLSKAAPVAADGNSNRRGYGCIQLIMKAREFKTLNPKKFVDATIHDLLLAAMHKTIHLWNQGHGVDTGLIRVQTPVNLRPAPWTYEEIGNYIGTFPTNSLPGERASAAKIMAVVYEQTQSAKASNFGQIMYESMQLQSKMPAFLKEKLMPVLLNSLSTTSACVSNLGRVPAKLEFGPEKAATEVWVSPPAAMPMGIGLGVVGYNGALFFTFRYANDLFDAKAAQQFAVMYRRTLDWLS